MVGRIVTAAQTSPRYLAIICDWSARINGGENTVFTTSARSQNRDFRMMRADACHDLRGSCTGCHIDDGRTGKNLAFGDFIILRDRGDDRDVHHRHGRFDGFRRCRSVDDHAGRALHLRHHGQLCHTRTGGGASTHADEQRHLRHGEQRLRDHRFAGERVYREDGVRVRVADNDRIGGIGERFERMTFDGDAAATLRDDFRNPGVGGGESAFDLRRTVGASRHVRHG